MNFLVATGDFLIAEEISGALARLAQCVYGELVRALIKGKIVPGRTLDGGRELSFARPVRRRCEHCAS